MTKAPAAVAVVPAGDGATLGGARKHAKRPGDGWESHSLPDRAALRCTDTLAEVGCLVRV
jgi:hypothetical protein